MYDVYAKISTTYVYVGCWVGKYFEVYSPEYKYHCKTDELLNPRPTPPKKKYKLKSAFGPLFPAAKQFFVGWDCM